MVDESDAVDQIRARLSELYPRLDTKAYGVTARILRLAQMIETRRAEQLATYGLTPGEFDVLATLRRTDQGGGVNPGQFLEPLLITSGGLSKRLDRLELAGLIERLPDPADRRGTLIRLTSRGLEAIDRVLPMVIDQEGEATRSKLSDHQLDQTSSLLRRLSRDRD